MTDDAGVAIVTSVNGQVCGSAGFSPAAVSASSILPRGSASGENSPGGVLHPGRWSDARDGKLRARMSEERREWAWVCGRWVRGE